MSRQVFQILASALLVATVLGPPVAAKMPGFDVVLSSNVADAGSTIRVTVTLHEELTGVFEPPNSNAHLDGLLGLFRAGEVDLEQWRALPGARPIELRLARTSAVVYEGDLTLPSQPGEYLLLAFPHETRPLPDGAREAYPAPIRITARPDASGHAQGDGTSPANLVVISSAVVAVAGIALNLKRRRAPLRHRALRFRRPGR